MHAAGDGVGEAACAAKVVVHRPGVLLAVLAGDGARGLVDGPVYKDINDSLKFEPFGDDPYERFQSEVGVYHDTYGDFSTNEPIIDGTVSLLLLLELWNEAE